MFSVEVEVNQLAQTCLIFKAKIGEHPLQKQNVLYAILSTLSQPFL